MPFVTTRRRGFRPMVPQPGRKPPASGMIAPKKIPSLPTLLFPHRKPLTSKPRPPKRIESTDGYYSAWGRVRTPPPLSQHFLCHSHSFPKSPGAGRPWLLLRSRINTFPRLSFLVSALPPSRVRAHFVSPRLTLPQFYILAAAPF